MILFGCALGSEQQYRTIMVPGIRKSCKDELIGIVPSGEPGHNTSIFPLYDDIIKHARDMSKRFEIEALVLLHTDLELDDVCFAQKIRKVFKAHPSCAIIGAIGGRGVNGCEWWKGATKIGYAKDSVTGIINFGFFGDNSADTVDGMLLVLSPWAIDHLEADCETYNGFHAYDADLCAQARSAGKTVHVECFSFLHRCKKTPTGGQEALNEADKAFRAKWKRPGYAPPPLPKQLARLAGREKDNERPARYTGPRRGSVDK